MSFIPYYQGGIYETLRSDEPPFIYRDEEGCNIAAAAGNEWTPSGPIDVARLLCRQCQQNVVSIIGPEDDFQVVAKAAARDLIACSMICPVERSKT